MMQKMDQIFSQTSYLSFYLRTELISMCGSMFMFPSSSAAVSTQPFAGNNQFP